MDKVTIGIPTYNGWLRVHQLLQNINQRTPRDIDFNIIVCDDSGKQEHRDRVKDICQSLGAEYIYHKNNRGVPSSWNTLVKASSSEYVILLNDDILVANNWLKHPIYALKNNPKVGSFGLHCYFISPDDVAPLLQGPEAVVVPLDVRWVGDKLITNERYPFVPPPDGGSPGKMMCPTGCAFGFRREMWEEVGGFDERYRAFYEETDFGVSCAYRGYPSFQLPYPGNYHLWSQTFRSASEINAGKIINESKAKFIDKWSKQLNYSFNDAPDIHDLLMDKIPLMPIKWLDIWGNEHEDVL